MNKPLIITIAICVLLLAIGSWLYLFLFGAPQSPNEVFTDLGILPANTTEDGVFIPNATSSSDADIDINTTISPLQQLTIRPVAGFWVDDELVRYVEQGTGHVYEINTSSGSEKRISNTSIPVVSTALFGPDGNSLVLVSEVTNTPRHLVATLEDGALKTTELPPDAINVTYTSSSTIIYTRNTTDGSVGYEYNITSNQQAEVFTTQLQSFLVRHHEYTDTVYLIPRPATELEGIVFKLVNNQLETVGNSAFALVIDIHDQWLSRTYARGNELISEFYNFNTDRTYRAPISLLPEKCDWYAGSALCAAPLIPPPHTYIEDWYKGIAVSNDAIWQVIPTREEARLRINPQTSIGRPLDMIGVHANSAGNVFFINRPDNTLWMYDASTD